MDAFTLPAVIVGCLAAGILAGWFAGSARAATGETSPGSSAPAGNRPRARIVAMVIVRFAHQPASDAKQRSA